MIVITVPHAASLRDVPRNDIGIPLKPTAHYTDWLAEPAARMLHAKLPGSILIVGDVDRRISDLNRRESRETDFRKKVGKIVANANEPVLLLDVHSANTNFFGLADLTIVQPNAASWPDYFLAMLLKGRSNWRRMRSVEGYTTSFLKTMNSSGIPTNMMGAWPLTTDLIYETKGLGAASLLIEFNEEMIRDTTRLDYITTQIAQWASQEDSLGLN